MTTDSENQPASTALKILAVGVALIALSLAYRFGTPLLYSSTARVSLHRWTAQKADDKDSGKKIAPMESRKILTDEALDQVIKNLGGNIYLGTNNVSIDVTASPASVRSVVRSKVSVRPLRNSLLIEISANGQSAAKCAALVNELASLYVSNKNAEVARYELGIVENYRKNFIEADRQVKEAQDEVDRLYFAVEHERLQDTNQYYEPRAFETLVLQKVRLEQELKGKEKELADLKSMSNEDLRQALTTSETNELLTSLMVQLNKVQSVVSALGTDSSEGKSGKLLEADLNKKIDNQMKSVLALKTAELEGIREAFNHLKTKLQNATSSTPPPSLLYAKYLKAKQDLDSLEKNRMELSHIETEKMRSAPAEELSLNYGAEVIDYGVVAFKPISPNPKVALIGGFIGFIVSGISALKYQLDSRKTPQKAPSIPSVKRQ